MIGDTHILLMVILNFSSTHISEAREQLSNNDWGHFILLMVILNFPLIFQKAEKN